MADRPLDRVSTSMPLEIVSLNPCWAVFTVCNLAYLPKALALCQSVYATNRIKPKIYLIDRKIPEPLAFDFAEVHWVEDVGLTNWRHLAFMYDITEFSTSVKPFIAQQLLASFEKVVFLDPDTFVYGALSYVLTALDEHPIVLTPHFIRPHEHGDLEMLRFGSFNLGFFAVNGSPRAREFLTWWHERCMKYCFFEAQFGLSTDQKWVSIAPCFFPEMHISHHGGLNVAFWNIHERELASAPLGHVTVNSSQPLVFFHFSAFDAVHPERLSKRVLPFPDKLNDTVVELARSYGAAVQAHARAVPATRYAFDFMSNGAYISPTLRRAYAARYQELSSIADPFDASSEMAAFITGNHLQSKGQGAYGMQGFEAVSRYRRIFSVLNFFMRSMLYLMGPNRFMNFSRLLVYLSSYRLNKGLWRV